MIKRYLTLLLILLTFNSIIASDLIWPIKRKIDLSSGFGDFRQNRFHAGVDIRTGGKEGEPVYAPTDSWLYRIKMSYNGYGKGLYIQDSDGHLYVFGHLKDFSENIDKIVKRYQLKIKRYYFDQYYLKDSIFIKQGELIGYSGQTGTGAPHLHFEKRKTEFFPLNPLTHGFDITDNVKPTIRQVVFKMLDDNALFENGKRELVVDVISNGNGNYRIDKTLNFQNRVGIVVDVFDQMRTGGMKQTVTNLSLLIDGNPVYKIIHDTLDFRTMRSVNLEFDYNRAVENQKTFRRLYHIDGNDYKGSNSLDESNGILDPALLSGKHTVKIIVKDSYGNSSNLKFDFEMNQDINLSSIDNTIDSIDDTLFQYFELDYQIVDNGLLVSTNGLKTKFKNSMLKLFNGETILESLSPIPTIIDEAVFYISPQPKFNKIDKIEFSLLINDNIYRKKEINLNINSIGFENNQIAVVDKMTLEFNNVTMYQPRFVEIKNENEYYNILPEAFLCKEKFPIVFSLDTTKTDYKKSGLYWYDKKHDEWLWIENKIVNDTLYSYSEGGGSFAILKDTLAPSIRNLSIKNLKTYFTSMPKISFNLEDDLSWIEDDRNFLITLDDDWLIPEYDIEQKLFQTKPNKPLNGGKHRLNIQITDRVGNKYEQNVEFYVKIKQNKKGN